MSHLLVFNAGSSTIKLGIFARTSAGARRIANGMIDLRLAPLQLRWMQAGEKTAIPIDAPLTEDLAAVTDALLAWLDGRFGGESIAAAGHRIVHGGMLFDAPVRLDDAKLAQLDTLAPLAPLHQPAGLRLVRAVQKARSTLPQVACFDTAFHRTQAPLVTRMAIPRALHDEGVRRYGFHGLSYQAIADKLRRDEPDLLAKKLVVAHLGSGCSLCAMENGISRDTSMGFSALDGIPMATRPGELDAGVPLYLQQQRGMSVEALQHWLYHDCGMKGVSGIDADMRVLIDSDAPAAREAVELFAFRTGRGIAALANTLQGLDGVVFTAGIGEHQAPVRARIVEQLSWLGATLDADANQANARRIDADGSRLALRVIPTDEEQVIADAVRALVP